MSRRPKWRYGHKSYAMCALIQALRRWAKAKRAVAMSSWYGTEHEETLAFGAVLQTQSLLGRLGLWTPQMEAYYERRFDQICRIGHIWRGRGERHEAYFVEVREGKRWGRPAPVSALLQDNEDPDLAEWLRIAARGEQRAFGGGAAQAIELRRVA